MCKALQLREVSYYTQRENWQQEEAVFEKGQRTGSGISSCRNSGKEKVTGLSGHQRPSFKQLFIIHLPYTRHFAQGLYRLLDI